jgi:RNA polymerase sigma-70 factor (ECF subfamily)
MRPYKSESSQSGPSDKTKLDSTAIADLYDKYWLTLLLYIRPMLPSLEDAEDVLVEVFLAALESDVLATLAERQQIAWLRRVAHNKTIDHHRHSARRPVTHLEDIAEHLFDDDELGPERVALRHEEVKLLTSWIAELPGPQQEVLQLRFGDGLRCAEIARRMNRSEGAVRTLLSRTLNILRGIYDRRGEVSHE